MSRRRTRTYGDVVRDVARRRQARKQMIIDMEATRLLQLVGHAPLCAMHMLGTGGCRCAEARRLGWADQREPKITDFPDSNTFNHPNTIN